MQYGGKSLHFVVFLYNCQCVQKISYSWPTYYYLAEQERIGFCKINCPEVRVEVMNGRYQPSEKVLSICGVSRHVRSGERLNYDPKPETGLVNQPCMPRLVHGFIF